MGYLDGGDSREKLRYLGGGPTVVITDLGILRPDRAHPCQSAPWGELEQAREATGWDLKAAEDLGTTDPRAKKSFESCATSALDRGGK